MSHELGRCRVAAGDPLCVGCAAVRSWLYASGERPCPTAPPPTAPDPRRSRSELRDDALATGREMILAVERIAVLEDALATAVADHEGLAARLSKELGELRASAVSA